MSNPPVRGTQSFVGVMGEVWRRPSLAAMEIAWRWLAGLLALFILAPVVLGSLGMEIHFAGGAAPIAPPNFAAIQGITIFKPVIAIQTLQASLAPFLSAASPFLQREVPLAFLLWNLIAAFGRTLVLRRLDKQLHPRRLTLFLLGTLRALLLSVAWLFWFRLLAYAANTNITAPAARGDEPHLVLFSAMLISGTLILYVAWGIVSWPLYLAPLLAMRNNLGSLASLRAALGSSRGLRGKLIEINLVMNIVRITLIVLAMVMSASPLAFQTVATQQFFAIWWGIAVLLYLAASDYFHVVRSAAYLSLHRVYNLPLAS
jgi:hypothetical protein